MPNVLNDYIGYNGEFMYEDAVTGEVTAYDTTFVPDWKVDEDPRLVAGYVECLSERYMDRNNDVYLDDVLTSKSGVTAEDPQYAALYGYTLVPAASRTVRCWYCNEDFSYREFAPGRYISGGSEEAFVTEMLLHYSSHRAAGDLPFVTTYFPGRTITTPSGTVYTKPGVVRTWRINGKLL